MYPEEKNMVASFIIILLIATLLTRIAIALLQRQKEQRLLLHTRKDAEIRILEAERKRVAADLHDSIGPALSAVRLKLECIEGLEQGEAELLEAAKEHLQQIFSELLEIANDLVPDILQKKGIEEAVEDFIETISQGRKGILFESSHIPKLDPVIATHTYRILQEIMHNTIKHARATTLHIHMAGQNNRLIINTSDNGTGFHYDPFAGNGRGSGLVNLHNRVQLLGGHIRIQSKPGNGTQIFIEIPV